ncbi:MAG: valine--tRNA ligase, partial [Pseudomonadota bacterium]
MLEKTFDHAEAEERLYARWEEAGCFRPKDDPSAETYCIVIPPPNVTGNLHMGHALNNTLQDVLCRFERMRGKAVLWQPGTDHAGIATQMVVERQLMENQQPTRQEMGREAFIEKVWEWKAQSGGAILNQLKRLGASCDWSRERFTLDEGLSAAVQKVFIALYKEGLIYRDKRLVNWDPKFQTAISDLEVESTEVQGHFWHFKYPLEKGETYKFPIAHDEEGNPTEWEERDYIAIATTRPETMLGDGAVAVHPSDARYAPIVGKRVLLPLADRYIPIIADEHPDPEFGSGAVKITGAHDFNDFQVAKRHGLPMYDIMDDAGRMDGPIPEKYKGLDRFEARKRVVADIDALGLLERVEDKVIQQPFGDRSGVVVEPRLKDQWFVDAETLAKPAIAAVEEGATKFVPENWSKTYFQWMRNIEPWCISRQLWWGHQIPAWFGPDGKHFVAESEHEAIKLAKAHYGADVRVTVSSVEMHSGVAIEKGAGESEKLVEVILRRDPDVLDTWFSSQLWPFSTLGWPEETNELKRFYKTDVLVTGFDIIFFWVARMMMAGLHFMEEVPFHTVYIHALVRDADGQKMSKSKGNVVDPLDLVEKYGADALRFFLTAMAAQGRDIRLSEQRVEGYRNFGTKLWNAARFCQMNECAYPDDFDPSAVESALNKWV